MKALVVYYSNSGVTRKMAEDIAAALGAEIEELHDTVKRGGPMGFFHAGSDAGAEKLTVIEPTTKNPTDYDLAIIGTPTWGGKMCPATRTYLTQNKGKLNKVAFFCASAFGRSQPRARRHGARDGQDASGPALHQAGRAQERVLSASNPAVRGRDRGLITGSGQAAYGNPRAARPIPSRMVAASTASLCAHP